MSDPLHAGEAAILAADWPMAQRCLELAFEQFRDAGKAAEASKAARRLAFLCATGHDDISAAAGWIERARTVPESASASDGQLIMLRATMSRDPAEREQLAAAALAIARRHSDDDLEIEALALLGEARVAGGRVSDGMRLLDAVMAGITTGRMRDQFALAEAYCRLLRACEAALDVRRATDWLSQLDRHVAWTDYARPTCRTHYGAILVALGRWTEAESELLSALEAFEPGYRGARSSAALRLADLRVRQGRVQEAERLLEGGEQHPLGRRIAAAIALVSGDATLAGELGERCTEGSERADPTGVPALELLVATRLALGDVARAAEAAARLTAIARETRVVRVEASAALAQGRVHAAEDDQRATVELARAAELFASLGLPLEAARAQLALAGVLSGTASAAAAREAKLALAVFERLGAVPDADAAAALVRRLGAAGDRAWPRKATALTRREDEVLSLLAEGCSNAQVAERLAISTRTAEHHVASILAKLDVRNRTEAVAYGQRTKG